MPLFGPFASRAYLAGVARGDLVPVFDDSEPAAALAAFRRGGAGNAFRFAPGSPFGAGFPAGFGPGSLELTVEFVGATLDRAQLFLRRCQSGLLHVVRSWDGGALTCRRPST